MTTITGIVRAGASCGVRDVQALSSSAPFRNKIGLRISFPPRMTIFSSDSGPRKIQHLSSSVRSRSSNVSAAAGRHDATVVVTREQGKNWKLMKALNDRGINCLELPLIEHKEGPDYPKLAQTLRDFEFEWIVVTSPEAATVFLSGWRAAGHPKVRLSVVGSGTGEVLEEVKENRGNIEVAFTPSKATAKVLAVELPKLEGGNGEILYPSSAKAGSDLENGLTARGFKVSRLNTYSTESVKGLDQDKVAAALAAPVATFASPTAVRAWVELVGKWDGAAACIGSTSAKAAKTAGLNNVFYPGSPGIDGWVESVIEALDANSRRDKMEVKIGDPLRDSLLGISLTAAAPLLVHSVCASSAGALEGEAGIPAMSEHLSPALSFELLHSVGIPLADLDPSTANLAITLLGPLFAFFNLLFIFRIVMSWYPQIPVSKFPFVLAYAPTEPILGPTRRLIPPVGGVDVAPVIWVALMSFLNEILLGKQGLLILLSQQQS